MDAPESTLHNLPPSTSSFVGRRDELARLRGLLEEGHRLINLFGPAGTGKTALCRAYAQRLVDDDPPEGGVWWADLGHATGLDAVATSVAAVLSVPLSAAPDTETTLRRVGNAIAARGPILVILDNVEHLAAETGEAVEAWLRIAPELRVITTSRVQLQTPSEIRFELSPLRLPGPAESIEDADAVALLLSRVRAFEPDFTVGPENAPQIDELVRRLEGIPLAIELAASRLELFGLESLVDRLRERFDVVAEARTGAAGRHETLRSAIAWSWELLSAAERRIWARCAVFRGGFDADAASEILSDDADTDTLEQILALRRQSLLRRYDAEEHPGHSRFGMYEALREFAEDRLGDDPRREDLLGRHARYYLEAGTRWAQEVDGKRGAEAVRFLALERENLLAVHEAALWSAGDDAAAAARAIEALLAIDALAAIRGITKPHRQLLEQTLDATRDAEVPPQLRARALRAHGRACQLHGDLDAARRDFEAAVALAPDDELRARIRADLAVVHHGRRDMDAARPLYEQALREARTSGDRHTEGRILGNMGALQHDLRDLTAAAELYDQALGLLREVGDERLEGIHLANLGVLEQEQGQREAARGHYEAARELLARRGDRRLLAIVLGNLGALEYEELRLEEALHRQEEALHLLREVGDRRSEALGLGRLARVNAGLGQIDQARGCLAAADRLLGRYRDPVAAASVAVERGFLDLALARRAQAEGNKAAVDDHVCAARERISRATNGDDGGPAWVDRVDDIRTAVRLLDAGLHNLTPSAPATVPDRMLRIGDGGEWFEIGEESRQDISRRKALRLILDRLAAQRLDSPGAGLSLTDLLNAGWPGERVVPAAAANRVYVALTTLRKLGLRGVLLSQDGGYLLDPAVAIERAA